MARLPYVDPETAPEKVKAVFEKLPHPLHVFRMMAHAEKNFRHLVRFATSVLAEQQLDARLRELAILEVAKLSNASYEWEQHVPVAKAVGATDEQIAAIERGDTTTACFDDDERLVLRFTDEIVRDVRASDETFAAVSARFSDREVVELILAIGCYMMIARLLETTGVDPDAPLGDRLFSRLPK